MNIDTFRDFCLNKKGVTEELPFGPDTLVFKVIGKMFALASLDEIPLRANLKCDPEKTIELRETHDQSILPGYHMNKKHWNTIKLDGTVPAKEISRMIDNSYGLVVKSLKKSERDQLLLHYSEQELFGQQ